MNALDMEALRREMDRVPSPEGQAGMSVLVTREAPPFTALAVMPDDTFKEITLADLRGRYVTLVFCPLDFSAVSPTEILAIDHRIEQFRELDCEVIGSSVDSQYVHRAWRKIPVDEGSIGPIRFPLVTDLSKQITRDYGVLVGEAVALRATFLIDRAGVVRHQVIYDPDIGRNIEYTLRTRDALRHIETWEAHVPRQLGRGA